MQAFIEGGALIGQMLQRPRWRHWPTEMNATGGWQWLGVSHCRPKSGKIVGVGQVASRYLAKLIQVALGIKRCHTTGTGRGAGLAVDMVLYVTGGENARD